VSGGLTHVKVRIKFVIIIVLKPNLMTDPGHDLDHGSGGLTRVDPLLFKKKKQKESKQSHFDLKEIS
jgi:hypothetical protein